jgi:hypothetical protein
MTSPTYFGPQTPSGGYVDYTATGPGRQTQFYYQLTDNPGVEVPLGSVGKAKTLPAAGPRRSSSRSAAAPTATT